MEALQYMDSASADWQAEKWKRNTTTGLPWGKKLINKAFVISHTDKILQIINVPPVTASCIVLVYVLILPH